LLKEYVNP